MFIDNILIYNLLFLCFILIFLNLKFMLMMLMIFELLIMLISFLIFLTLNKYNLEINMIFYLIFSVCESVLGLMILILLIRLYGNELYYSLNLFKFI